MQTRVQLKQNEMRVSKTTDAVAGAHHLKKVCNKLQWPKIQVTAVGPAIINMEKIIEHFQTLELNCNLIIERTERNFGEDSG